MPRYVLDNSAFKDVFEGPMIFINSNSLDIGLNLKIRYPY